MSQKPALEASQLDPPDELPPEIRSPLRRLRARVFLTRALSGLGAALLASALLLGAAFLSDRFFLLSTAARLFIAWTTAGGVALAVTYSLWRLLGPLPWAKLARRVEAAVPDLEEGLLSSVEIAALPRVEREAFSAELLEALFQSTARKLIRVPPASVVDLKPARRLLWAGLAAWGALGVPAALDPPALLQLARRLLHPSADLPRPSTVSVLVSPGSITLARGDDVEIRGQVVRGSPKSGALLVRPEAGSWTEYPLAGPSLSLRLSALQKGLEYRLRAGDFLSSPYEIKVRDAPRPLSFQIAYHYPRYTSRPAETLSRPTGEIAALKGTLVDLEITASEPLHAAALELIETEGVEGTAGTETGRGSHRDLEVSANKAAITGLEVASARSYRLFLAAPDGVTNGWRARYGIRPIQDRPPRVEVLDPRGAEVLVEPSSLLEIRYQAEDDNGVRAVELRSSFPGRDTPAILLKSFPEPAEAPRAVRASYALDLAGLGLSPGESLSLHLSARDGLGQGSLSPELTLRAAFVPDPPEGPGWPSRLQDLEDAVRAALDGWGRLLPAAGGEAPEALSADPARTERFRSIPEKTLELLSFVRQAARGATEAGRSIAVPSPNRRALENLGRLLRQTAAEEAADFWAESVAVSGRMKSAVPPATVPTEKLYELHRAAGSRLDGALSSLRAIHRAERLEDALERCLLVGKEIAELRATLDAREERPKKADPGAALREVLFETASRGRARNLLVETTAVASALTSLAAESHPDRSLEATARRLLETVVAQLDLAGRGPQPGAGAQDSRQALRLAAGVVASVSEELSQRYEREERLAAEARALLEPKEALEELLAALAKEAGTSPPDPRVARSIIYSLSEELDAVESREYADLETTGDLSALREVFESIARAAVAREAAAREKEASLDRPGALQELLAAFRATGPSRKIGGAIQELSRIAGGEESLAWKLDGARSANYRALRAHARTQREILRALLAVRPALEGVREAEDIQAAFLSLDDASRGMQVVFQSLASSRRAEPGAEEGSSGLAPVAGEARRSARQVDELVERLERVRAALLPGAAAARKWLRSQLGAVPERMARLAAAEREHAGKARELSASASSQDFAARASALFTSHEETRRDAADLAVKARKEGDRLLASGASVERLRAHDRAAVRLSRIASQEMLEGSRFLRAAGAADAGARGGICLEAALQEEKAAEEIEQLARALATIEADEGLRLSAKEIEELLKRKMAEGASLDPTRIAAEARLFLEGTLRAAEALSSRLQPDPQKQSLLDLLRQAAERFREALELAKKNDAPRASGVLSAGRQRLDEAIQLARKIRGEGEGALAEAEESLKKGEELEKKLEKEARAEVSREAAAVYEELKKVLELASLQKEAASLFEELLGKEKPDPSKVEDLKRKEGELSKDLDDRLLSLSELVELVSRLVLMDREGREIAAAERALAAASQKGHLEPLEAPQGDLVARAQKVVKEFYASGFKLSAVLPFVLKAYLKAGDAAEPLLQSMEEARRALSSQGEKGVVEEDVLRAAQSKLLLAAERVDSFLGQLSEMRRQTLEAIADEERGDEGAKGGLLGIERARRDLREAAQLLGQGDLKGASRAHDASGRSLEACAAALRSRAGELVFPSGEEGSLMSRILDEEAARLGLAWQASTRGEYLPPGTAVGSTAPEEMPYPAQFRELVRMYLKAVREGKR